jgi:hypothetical protein
MDDDGWALVESAAKVQGETTSEYVRRVLLRDAARVTKQKG